MNEPMLLDAQVVAKDTTMLPAWLPVPGFGVLAVNAYVIGGPEPVLVDTGLAALGAPFLAALERVVDPADLRWIWLTHTDPDHIGSLRAVLARAPQARVVTPYLGMGKLGLQQLPVDRVHLLNPGQGLDLPDRQLVALRPPTYDAPETLAAYDTATGALFSADCFGALLEAPVTHADGVAASALRDGLIAWATVDAPWLALAQPEPFRAALGSVARLAPSVVLSSHLPPAPGDMTAALLAYLDDARGAPAFVGPDQAALEAMLAGNAAAA